MSGMMPYGTFAPSSGAWPVMRSVKSETYFDQATGLERRRRVGGLAGGDFAKTIGSKREVWNGTAEKTPGGLTIDKLGKNKRGHIVSIAKHLQGKQRIGQLARSPYFGRIQDIAARAGGKQSKAKSASSPRAKTQQQQQLLRSP